MQKCARRIAMAPSALLGKGASGLLLLVRPGSCTRTSAHGGGRGGSVHLTSCPLTLLDSVLPATATRRQTRDRPLASSRSPHTARAVRHVGHYNRCAEGRSRDGPGLIPKVLRSRSTAETPWGCNRKKRRVTQAASPFGPPSSPLRSTRRSAESSRRLRSRTLAPVVLPQRGSRLPSWLSAALAGA
jgi:hypothetical protein